MKSGDKNYASSNVGFYNYLISYLIDAECMTFVIPIVTYVFILVPASLLNL